MQNVFLILVRDITKHLRYTKQILEVQGLKVFLYKLKKFLFWSDHNADIKKIIEKYSSDYNVFVDIGTNVGSVVLDVAKNFTTCICFEPSINTYNDFMNRLNDTDITNVLSYQYALGEKKGKRKLFLSPFSSGDNRLHIDPAEKWDSQEVEVHTLDEIFDKLGINEKCIIKLDVQGSELDVIKGSLKILQKDCVILSEFWPRGFRVNNTKPYEFIRFMKSLGYSFFHLNEEPIKDEYLERISTMGENKGKIIDDFLIKKT